MPKNLWSSQYKSISPGDLKQRVGRYKSEFAGRDQQDSHEFGSKLLEWLHDDTNKVKWGGIAGWSWLALAPLVCVFSALRAARFVHLTATGRPAKCDA